MNDSVSHKTKVAHTLGEWQVEPSIFNPFNYCVSAPDERSHVLPGARFVLASGLQEPDAHLIAASPRLLSALRELVRSWDRTTFPVSDQMQIALDDADAAIAKAEGR